MTAAKLASNRTNAQRSTGPNDTTQTRFNGVRHGLTSKQTVIPGESQEVYDQFRRDLLADLNPKSATENVLADRIVAAAWRLQRFERMEAAFFTDRINAFVGEHPEADPEAAFANLFVDPAESARMRLFLRYQNSVQREYDKAMHEYARAQAAREKQAFEEAFVRASEQRQASQNKPEAAVGFASQPPAAPVHLVAAATGGGTSKQPVDNGIIEEVAATHAHCTRSEPTRIPSTRI